MSRGTLVAKLFATRRGQAGAMVLALLALFALFADFLASDAPVLLWSDTGVSFLPAVTRPAEFAGRPAEQIASRLAPRDLALWPLSRHGPSVAAPGAASRPGKHLLGTDAFGRDTFARLVHGTRTALGLGLLVALTALVAGCVAGAAAGLVGGYTDMLVARFAEISGVFPAVIVIALVHALVREPSVLWIAGVVAIVRAADTACLVRVLLLRDLPGEVVEAARALGAGTARIAFSHALPRIRSQILVSTVFSFGAVVLVETSLSFLGLGHRSDTASWGEMLSEVGLGAGPLVLIPPAAALLITLGALCLVADAMREPGAGSR